MEDEELSSSSDDHLVIVTDEEIEPDEMDTGGGEASNVFRSERVPENIVVRAGPSWAAACKQAEILAQACALQAREPGWHHLGDRSVPEVPELSGQTPRCASRIASRRGSRIAARPAPYRQNRDNRKTRAAQPNPFLTYPNPSLLPLAIPPLRPIIQNPGPPQHLHTIRQILSPNYTHSTRPHIAVRSPSQLFAPRTLPQLSPRSSPMMFISNTPPKLIPITPAAHMPSFTSAAPLLERPLPTLIPITQSQASPISFRQTEPYPSARSTLCTHTVTSPTSNVVYHPSSLLPILNVGGSNQLEPRTHLLHQPERHRPRTPIDSLLEHQQCQLWPLDTFVATDLVEEVETTDYDLWLNTQSATSTAVSPTPINCPQPTVIVSPRFNRPTATATATTSTITSTTENTSWYGDLAPTDDTVEMEMETSENLLTYGLPPFTSSTASAAANNALLAFAIPLRSHHFFGSYQNSVLPSSSSPLFYYPWSPIP